MRRSCPGRTGVRLFFFLLALLIGSVANAATKTITMLHFSDYHSHALPFYSEEQPDQGGIARALGYLKEQKKRGALVFSGGDMINGGSPAWSDRFRCAEWPWFNGVVDAMALGNHDADYGRETLAQCRASVQYPILSANTGGFLPYAVFGRNGVRIGVFAVAGPDFPTLMKSSGLEFGDSLSAARETVRALREKEQVGAVVLIGHEQIDDDFALARAVPGIDLIFGTHSHRREDLTRIPGTKTWFISPFQYLTYISRVEMTFANGELRSVRGRLVRVDRDLPVDRRTATRVESMQRDLERDPGYRALFEKLATAAGPLSVEGQLTGDSPLGDLVMDVMRSAAGADVAISTASSFRQSIASGAVSMESLRAALPYDNEILVCSMTGEQLKKILSYSASRIGSDFFSQVSGVRFSIDGKHNIGDVMVLSGPGETRKLDPARIYRVATTDYQARVAPGYRELFAGLQATSTGLHLRDEVRRYLTVSSPVAARSDDRIAAAH